MRTVIAIALLLLATVAMAKYSGPDREGLAWGMETESNGWGPENVTQHSGYIAVNKKVDNGGHIFYWMFESRDDPANDPLILWMTGGPGCSSELAVFYEQGPYRLDSEGTLSINENAWNSHANILFVDQPVGTGFSYADHNDDYVKNEDEVAQDMYEFLQTFYVQYPQYQHLEFFVTGESYAGHYVPAVSHRIFTALQDGEGPFDIPLTGFAIGNGLTNPLVQYTDYPGFAYDNNLISKSTYNSLMNNNVPRCEKAIERQSMFAQLTCNGIMSTIRSEAGNFNVYDIRKPCIGALCYDFSALDKLMAEESVLESLGVSSRADWANCNNQVHADLNSDWFLNCEVYVPAMIESGIRALIYAGKEDFICNWYGNRHWVQEMEWEGQDDYNNQDFSNWMVNGEVAGTVKTQGTLTFLGIDEAGHMVPMDQPENALEMITRFTRGESFVSEETIILE